MATPLPASPRALRWLGQALVALAFLAGAWASWRWVSAVATAHLRFGACGPTDLAHPDPACQVGARLALEAMWFAGGSLVGLIVGATLWAWALRPPSRPAHRAAEG